MGATEDAASGRAARRGGSADVSPRAPNFGVVAASYDELRPQDEGWWQLFDLLVREADLAGRRVLDVGCGTGRWSAALAERGARVWGIDASPEMVAQARGRGVNAKVARAEALPFKDGWFERALLVLVIHVLDRPQTFAELRRVLGLDGRIALVTFDERHFADYHLNPYFPSLADVDRARFPTATQLETELTAAGFTPRWLDLRYAAELGRDEVLERIRGRFISTLQLLDPEEFAAGLAQAEHELPDRVETVQHWLVGIAVRRPE